MRALTPEEARLLTISPADEITTIIVSAPRPPPDPPPPPTSLPPTPPPPTAPTVPPCPPNPTSQVNNAMLNQMEGNVQTKGYVPTSKGVPLKGSGVTIGGGIDLSYQYYSTLIGWGMSAADANTCRPFLATAPGHYGPQGTQAAAALAQYGVPQFSQTEMNTVTDNAIASYTASAASQYASITGLGSKSLYDLPANVQSALVETAYNAGSFSNSNALPGLSAALQSQDWSQVASILQSAGTSALRAAGNYIRQAIQNGSLPSSGQVCH